MRVIPVVVVDRDPQRAALLEASLGLDDRIVVTAVTMSISIAMEIAATAHNKPVIAIERATLEGNGGDHPAALIVHSDTTGEIVVYDFCDGDASDKEGREALTSIEGALSLANSIVLLRELPTGSATA